MLRRQKITAESKAEVSAAGLTSNIHPYLIANEDSPTNAVCKTFFLTYKLFLLALEGICKSWTTFYSEISTHSLKSLLNEFTVPTAAVRSVSRCIARSHNGSTERETIIFLRIHN